MDFILKEFLSINNCPFVYEGLPNLLSEQVSGISIDSRTIQPGEVYFALKGDKHDGHDFVKDALGKGAIAAVVRLSWWRQHESQFKKQPIFIVEDTLRALQEAASAYREKFDMPIIGLTGTNGKTTTKEMVAAVLGNLGQIAKTEGNLNNHIGLPLTLLRLHGDPKAAVLEMGMNHRGEIARLCNIAKPEYGLITNIGHGHLEFLKSLEGVAEAKTELFDYLAAANGTAFVNLDDPLIVKYAKRFGRSISYGINPEADVTGKLTGINEAGMPILKIDETEVVVNSVGAHNVNNALAAVAVGLEFGISLEKIKLALQNLKLPGKRLEVVKQDNIVILNDTYNANPESTRAALLTLKSFPCSGKKIFVFGDMLELGEQANHEHAKIGEALSQYGVDLFFAYGPHSSEAVSACQKANKKLAVLHFGTKDELIEELKKSISKNDVLLVKGSRGMKMEDIVDAIIEK